MRTFVRAGLAGALACGALVTVLTVGRGGDDPAPPQGPYVALGDSYTSGPRIPTQTGNPAGCDRSDANYPSLYVSDGADEVTARIDAAGERLAGALSEVRRRAPRAEVYVVGYPAILPSGGNRCADDMTLAPDDVRFLDAKERQLDSVLRERAEAAGAVYLDTYGPSVGRDACAARDTRWIEPLMPAADAAPVHPNERGERGMADAVVRALRSSG